MGTGAAAIEAIIGRSRPIERLKTEITAVARDACPVLTLGESGVGKELVVRAIDEMSGRRHLVSVNCAGLPESLADSLIFGHERGSFTGAGSRVPGLLEQANRGTLFLDEVAELPLATQAKLLRVFQDRRFRSVGGLRELTFDARVTAATHEDLWARAKAGLFREDLYHRVAVLELRVPSLRERADDIPPLARHFAKNDVELSRAAIATLQQFYWPGNVRQLQTAIHRLRLLGKSRVGADDVRRVLESFGERRFTDNRDSVLVDPTVPVRGSRLDFMAWQLASAALEATSGNVTAAAQSLRTGRGELRGLLRRLERLYGPAHASRRLSPGMVRSEGSAPSEGHVSARRVASRR